MTEIESRVISEAHFIIKNKTTIRKVAKEYGVSKSTVHFDLSVRLLKLNNALYEKVREILNNNFAEKHFRGGQSTKIKYQNFPSVS